MNCLIENPTFDSQTKETLTLKKDKWGSIVDLSPSFLETIEKTGLVEDVVSMVKFKQHRNMMREVNVGKKK